MDFNLLDVIIVLILLVLTARGLQKGFVRSIVSTVGLVGGILLASVYYTDLAPVLEPLLPSQYAKVASFVLIFIAVCVAASLIGYSLRKTLATAGVGALDRFFGAVLGLAKGFFVVVFLLVVLPAAFGDDHDFLRKSSLADRGQKVAKVVIPENLRLEIESYVQNTKDELNRKIKKMREPKKKSYL